MRDASLQKRLEKKPTVNSVASIIDHLLFLGLINIDDIMATFEENPEIENNDD